jgi:hypothetical protein
VIFVGYTGWCTDPNTNRTSHDGNNGSSHRMSEYQTVVAAGTKTVVPRFASWEAMSDCRPLWTA